MQVQKDEQHEHQLALQQAQQTQRQPLLRQVQA